ncbi:alternative ribosome rescue aminoacyl-tRNA hydrolase ArfB [Mucilaginibacter sp. KACC 22063]|uniref:alternative ribosome rescue aminoacyl-tRNA hydrolase ArfB n=1 Tax=Mucilaginibacter sp. KACC 22063 TaxID=3025666 RepID=UPI002366B495|nr:alternative ribosome rescue aminoacyl-tRNA hydrolase ArfB [Mucilaginibacter sp. KACC 22063]WDF56852.1 alternative ribosome rescue aminoacyl-tRNA hydrolase ArfB [Mucilaginibacter sp. KACC 22063]
MNFTKADLLRETNFKASRSGGKGGQNVNKVSTKVEIAFDVRSSVLFNEGEKQLLLSKLANRLNKDGEVQVICDEERSQYLNREKAIEKLYHLLHKAFEKPKPRKPTKISKAVKAARADNKRLQSAKKETRKRNFDY